MLYSVEKLLYAAAIGILVIGFMYKIGENVYTLDTTVEFIPVRGAIDSSELVPTVKDASKPVANVQSTSKPVTTVDDTSKPVTTVGDTSKPITTVDDTSKPVTTVDDTSKPVTTVEDASKPVSDLQDTSKPTTTVEDASKSVPNLKHTRFAICTSFWEQQTNALINMWTFQKWAKFTGFKVLEPFAFHSTLGVTDRILYHINFTNVLHFGDYFDQNLWTNMTKKRYGIPPFEKWNTFSLSPLKRTVVVILAYGFSPAGGFVDNDINKHQHCKDLKEKFYNKHTKLFKDLQLQVVRNVCIAFGSFTLHQFNSLFLLNIDTHVWLTDWRGIEPGRITINDHIELRRNFGGEDNILAMVKTSPRVLKDTRNYVNTILKTNLKKYTAVSFRATNKKTALDYSGHSREYIIQYFEKCAEKVKLELLKNPSSIKFLSIDLGIFGDLTSVYGYFKVNDNGNKLFKLVLKSVYGNKSIDEYHSELIRAANGIDDSGYIGSLEKNIAENAGKLIVVGGYSAFQRSMIQNFKINNANCQDCVIQICYG